MSDSKRSRIFLLVALVALMCGLSLNLGMFIYEWKKFNEQYVFVDENNLEKSFAELVDKYSEC